MGAMANDAATWGQAEAFNRDGGVTHQLGYEYK